MVGKEMLAWGLRARSTPFLLVALLLCLPFLMNLGSAAGLSINARKLFGQTTPVPMCDRAVTITPVESLGVTVSVTVSNIDASCVGWTLKLQTTNASNTPITSELTRVVANTTEPFVSLNISNALGTNRYYFAFQRP